MLQKPLKSASSDESLAPQRSKLLLEIKYNYFEVYDINLLCYCDTHTMSFLCVLYYVCGVCV